MAKKKKQRSWQVTKATGFGAKNLLPELHKAEAFMAREQWPEALTVLTDLNQTNPNQPRVLQALLSVYYELQSYYLYQRTCEQFLAIEPNNANINYLLAGVYFMNMHPLLALQTYQHCLERWPDHEQAETGRSLVAELESHRDTLLEEMQLLGAEGFELAVLHEQAQAYLEEGEFAKSRAAEEALLAKRPDFLPARNNLSLAAFMAGDTEDAIALCDQVLETDPENVHALANLTRYQCLCGKIESATATSERLKASSAQASEGWTKRAEALSFLGDFAGVLQLYEQAQQTQDWDEAGEHFMFMHLVAVAMARTGQIVEARQKWQQVLQHSPDFSLATENLDDSYQPPEKQQGAWPFDFQLWLPRAVTEALVKVMMSNRHRTDETLQAATERYLQDYPQVTAILPMLLDRGDPVGRAFAINTINLLATPEYYAFLRDFALGQQGTDQDRYTAATTAAKADLLSFGEPLRLWLQGEWREIQLVGYEFHEDSAYDHTLKVQQWLAEGNHLLRSTEDPDELRAAERLFEQARQSEPDSPDILNNLAGCYFRQGREEEAIALWTQIMEQFLDYVFARCALAQLHLKDNNLEAAQELLNPLIARRRFHYDEFAVFSRAQMTLLLAKDQVEGAENWLDIWASVDPDHPEVRDWQKRLDLRHRFDQLKLGRSR